MTKATNFAAVVALIAKAEALLRTAGQRTPEERAETLRGIYYGTTWSLDYEIESKRSVAGALIRNAGFITYTGGHVPADPRPVFGKGSLLRDLKDSQSMRDGLRSLDIGHLLIGLETRASSARAFVFPEGGTGLEVVTWLGDLGGGAANLARRRVKAPSTSVEYVFHNPSSDYGVTDNLEGDIAAYVVGSGGTPGGVPVYSGGGVAGAIRAYLIPASAPQWMNRATAFTTAIGGKIVGKRIENEPALVVSLATKLAQFGYWYAATRWVPTGELIGADALKTCQHMEGAAKDIASVFVTTLGRAIARAPTAVDAAGPYPSPAAPGRCGSTALQAAAVAGGSLPF